MEESDQFQAPAIFLSLFQLQSSSEPPSPTGSVVATGPCPSCFRWCFIFPRLAHSCNLRQSKQNPHKNWDQSTKLHAIISQKTVTSVKFSNLAYLSASHSDSATYIDGTYLACVRDSKTVEGAHCYMNDLLASQSFNQRGFPYMLICAMSQTKIVSLAPSPNL
jgi:hypothetical protein